MGGYMFDFIQRKEENLKLQDLLWLERLNCWAGSAD